MSKCLDKSSFTLSRFFYIFPSEDQSYSFSLKLRYYLTNTTLTKRLQFFNRLVVFILDQEGIYNSDAFSKSRVETNLHDKIILSWKLLRYLCPFIANSKLLLKKMINLLVYPSWILLFF